MSSTALRVDASTEVSIPETTHGDHDGQSSVGQKVPRSKHLKDEINQAAAQHDPTGVFELLVRNPEFLGACIKRRLHGPVQDADIQSIYQDVLARLRRLLEDGKYDVTNRPFTDLIGNAAEWAVQDFVRTHFRQNANHTTCEIDEIPGGKDPVKAAQSREFVKAVNEAILKLSPRLQRVAELEVAAILAKQERGKSERALLLKMYPGTYRTYWGLALEELAEILDGREFF